jgi:competence protein ComEC
LRREVTHHGSVTSSTTEFIRALRPQAAVVSVGRSSTSDIPCRTCSISAREAGADIFRTDRDGAVTIDTDGYSLDVRTFTGRHAVWKPPSAHHEDTKGTKP